ncbi:MAG TPA: four-carbon acid sugar kinase family protein [Phnomibacter sp.]|nr:four-carbon acid sugar kinase family protein [Phnomibacter sp.]
MTNKQQILLAYYGDDFTGSTDALEFISRAGAKAVLFIEPPTAEQLQRFPALDVIGVAGKTRSQSPEEMEKVLMPAFAQLKATGAKHVHYKVCSTFDSAPHIGSIGKAIDCGAEVFQNALIPVIGGMPALGRFCVFGNLFARMGTGGNGASYRLDRHPSMSKHPVTPADESDLRLHLSKQTSKTFGLIDVMQLETDHATWSHTLQDAEVVLVDALHDEHLEKVGAWMNSLAANETLFSVGGSSVEAALGANWKAQKVWPESVDANSWSQPNVAEPLLVVSGSCSPVTAGQIAWAKANGFEEVIIDAQQIVHEQAGYEAAINAMLALLQQQKNVIVHTGTKAGDNLSSEVLGTVLGTIAKTAVEQAGVKRVVIAGGDTSSYAARAMQIEAVEMIAPLISGAPLCKAHSAHEKINGLEVNFKGGQVGTPNYFGVLQKGQ